MAEPFYIDRLAGQPNLWRVYATANDRPAPGTKGALGGGGYSKAEAERIRDALNRAAKDR